MELSTCQFLWYLVFLFSMFAYAALDGFDIGVGLVHPFIRGDQERRICLNAIGPVWDSNSLWVIIAIGSLMAGFPTAFATLLSTLYLPMMILIFGYIYRAVALEFRSKRDNMRWRLAWDAVFASASYLLALGLGIALANLIVGLPLQEDGTVLSGIGYLFSPYALLLGLFAISLFMLHGNLYLYMKTAGNLHIHLYSLLKKNYCFFVIAWIAMNVVTIIEKPYVAELVLSHPIFFLLQCVGIASVITMPLLFKKQKEGWAFLSSCGVILSLVVSYALGTYPNIIRSTINQAYSLTIYNASSSHLTLSILLGIACTGVPLFFAYVIATYKVFRGKVEIDQMSY